MPKFKVGDKVKCVEVDIPRRLVLGQEYTIDAVSVIDGMEYVDVFGVNRSFYTRRFELVPNAEEGALGVVNEENGAIMLSPNVVKNTELFKNVTPYIHSISPEELLFNLCKCVNRRWDSEFANLNDCITWAETPQGTDFWLPLHQEYVRNKGGW